jgi:hypothetical protein
MFIILLLYNNGMPAPRQAKPAKGKSPETQLAAYIQYPRMLRHIRASVMAVSFRLNSKGQITQVQSHARMKELDTWLIRSLCGKKLKLPGLDQKQPYVVRLRLHAGRPLSGPVGYPGRTF